MINYVFSCPEQLKRWPCHSLLLLTYKEQPKRPLRPDQKRPTYIPTTYLHSYLPYHLSTSIRDRGCAGKNQEFVRRGDILLLSFPAFFRPDILYRLITICVREGVKNPRHGNFPLAGYPPTVPQKGVVFVKFQLFPKCFFSVCMIILGYCTHVFSIRTFYISIYEQNRDISIFWWPNIVKIVTFFWNFPVIFLDVL